ncbi:MAG: broad specificity phosphatase PhoE, partial [Paraglaciecola sp.]
TTLFCCLCFSANTLADDQTWYFVRHFEKMSGANPGLTEQGLQRAQNLAHYFAHIPLTVVYSSDYHRTRQTAQAVAAELSLKVEIYQPAQLAELAQELKLTSNVLVVGHSNTTVELVTLMGGKATSIGESDYGQLFIVHSKNAEIETDIQTIPLN